MTNSIFLIPLYNKSSSLQQTVELLKKKFENTDSREKFLFVENGSTDGSYEKILSLTEGDSRFHVIKSKKGFGIAIRTGMNYINENFSLENSLLILTASDLPFGFSDLEYCLELDEVNQCDIYLGSKAHYLSEVERTLTRTILSNIFNTLLKLFFGIRLNDTQGTCLIDLDRVDIAEIIPKSNSFFSTAEICIIASRLGYQIEEIPVIHEKSINDKSTVNIFSDSLNMFKELILFKLNKNY